MEDKKKIIVKGMHCEACKTLIQMEIEDAGFGQKVVNINLLENNTGEVSLKNISEEEFEKIKAIINKMTNYEVTN